MAFQCLRPGPTPVPVYFWKRAGADSSNDKLEGIVSPLLLHVTYTTPYLHLTEESKATI